MNKVQRHREIRAAMVRRGIKSCEIAQQLNITPSCVYQVISGRKNLRRVIAALIEAGISPRFFKAQKPKEGVEIRAEMVKKGIRSKNIAEELGVHQTYVCNVISGKQRSRRVVAALINAGVPARMFGKAASSINTSPAEEQRQCG